jgi:hypothetical protein
VFGDSDRDIAQFLMAAEREATNRAVFHQSEALKLLADYIRSDRRFDHLDPDRLAERVAQVRHNGAVLDLADTSLARGAPAKFDPLRGGSRSAY